MSGHLYNDQARKTERRRLRRNATDAEAKLWSMLRGRGMAGFKFFRQYGVGSYVLDFYCPERRLAVEVDGGQHAGAHGLQRDAERDGYLSRHGIRVIRLWNNEVLQNAEGVTQRIREELGEGS